MKLIKQLIFKTFDIKLVSKSEYTKVLNELEKMKDINIKLYEDFHDAHSMVKKVKTVVS